jgi:hypothetical protein
MRRSSLTVILLAAFGALAVPTTTRADRGAFTFEGGALVSAAQLPPGVGSGDSVAGSTLAGATLGVRYALRNSLEPSGTAASSSRGDPQPTHAAVMTSAQPKPASCIDLELLPNLGEERP